MTVGLFFGELSSKLSGKGLLVRRKLVCRKSCELSDDLGIWKVACRQNVGYCLRFVVR